MKLVMAIVTLVWANATWAQSQYQACTNEQLPQSVTTASCRPSEELNQMLASQYGETLQVQAVASEHHIVEFYSTPTDAENQSWSVVLAFASGASCIMDAGVFSVRPSQEAQAHTISKEDLAGVSPTGLEASQINFLTLSAQEENRTIALVNLDKNGGENWALLTSVGTQQPCVLLRPSWVELNFRPAPTGTAL